MTDALRERLTAELNEASWDMLELHHQHGVIFVVAPTLDLVAVGVAIASDDAPQISTWITDQRLRRPRPAEVEAWAADRDTNMVKFLIVQPYVIVQTTLRD